ncbi:ketopantoate reductase family protein [Sulfitobacter sp. AS92]|uniref:ketopantoate reductase family protein n=1 Tax=Sulfitobacter sp. AS92 TaxID=3135783 RepID=UPI00317AA82A
MKYAVLGAGALGSVVGGLIARNGLDVTLWDVNDTHINAVNNNGLKLDIADASEIISVPACRPEDGEEVDAIILLTKTLHTHAALGVVREHIDAGTMVLSLQNGLGNAERVTEMVPPDQTCYGCTMMPGRFLGPGHVASPTDGKAVFRALTPAGAVKAADIAIQGAGFSLKQDQEQTDQIIWQKAAFNCAMNAITAMQGGRIEFLSASKDGVALARDVAKETVMVANASGISANLDAVYAQMDRALANHQAHKPSMLQDMEAGRLTEIDALCGEVARQADLHGIEAPINKTLAVLVALKTSVQQENAR